MVAITMVLPAAAQQMQWREATQEVTTQALNDVRQSDGVEIIRGQESIIVRTPQRVQVRVFTILGQLVNQSTLPAGTSELQIKSRGVYIVKIGNITQKVAL